MCRQHAEIGEWRVKSEDFLISTLNSSIFNPAIGQHAEIGDLRVESEE